MSLLERIELLEKRVAALERAFTSEPAFGPEEDTDAEKIRKVKRMASILMGDKLPAEPPPVDYSARTLTDGSPVTADHREIDPQTGLQKAYVVLSTEERAKGFIRPVRRTYVHKKCGSVTSMGDALAETFARCPDFYSGTYCATCLTHFPLDEFTWSGIDEQVGT